MPTTRAILVGAVESSLVALEAIAGHPDWTLAAVVTLEATLEGRHSDFVDLGAAAEAVGSRVIRVDNINRDAALSAMAAVEVDHIFVIGWSQICGPGFRDLAEDRVIGYHPAALPRMRGRAAIPWTILNREPITAGTLFWIDSGTDTGDVLDQQYFHVAPDETANSLYAKHMDALRTMLARSLSILARGKMPRSPQDEVCATWAARRTPADGRIDWTAPADDVLRLIRASGRPYPGGVHLCWRAGSSALGCDIDIARQRSSCPARSGDCGFGRRLHCHVWRPHRDRGDRMERRCGSATTPCPARGPARRSSLMRFAPGTRIAVVAPHPDDEILGCGGTMARAAQAGAEVHVVVVTRGQPPQFDAAFVAQVRQETLDSHALVGVRETHFLDFPAAALDRVARADLNAAVAVALESIVPDILFVPFVGDIHMDHQIVFNAAMVYARPRSRSCPSHVLAYETLSETNWLAPGVTPGYLPNCYVDITDTLEMKVAAFRTFTSQVKDSPDERSIAAIRALAILRGATVYRGAAEAFMAIRQIH